MPIEDKGLVDNDFTRIFGRPFKNWTDSPTLVKWIAEPFLFLDWLFEKKAHSVVALVGDATQDAVSQFLVQKTRAVYFCAAVFLICETENTVYRVPEWVTAFTREVDKRARERDPNHTDKTHQLEIEKELALEVCLALIEAIPAKASEPSLEDIMKLGAAARGGQIPGIN